MPESKTSPIVQKAAPIQQFESAVDRQELMIALQSSEDSRFAALYNAMAKEKTPLLALCKRLGIGWHELVQSYRTHKMNEGIVRMMDHFPEVAEDTAIDAKSRLECCPKCEGEGIVPDGEESKPCRRCSGTGKVRVSGDAAARALLFEALGMKGQKGPMVAQQFNFGSGALEPLEKTVSVVQRITGGKV